MAKKTIYIVTSGDYSDYGICAVFSDRKAAKRYVETFNRSEKWDKASIETWPLDQPDEEWSETLVYLTEDGAIVETRTSISRMDWGSAIRQVGKYTSADYMTSVRTDDVDKAIKVARDRLAKFKAHKAGIA